MILFREKKDMVVQNAGHEHRNYTDLIKRLYVSVSPVVCNTKESTPDDFLKMGEVAYMEYYCFAQYQRLYGCLPHFNDKKNAPKLRAGVR